MCARCSKTEAALSWRSVAVHRGRSPKRCGLAGGGCGLRLCAARGVAISQAVPKNEDELIVPAREGTLRVLRAGRNAGVRRVVLTSSFAAIGYGQPAQQSPFDETNWTDPNGDDVRPYVKSKTLAERAAWDFIANEGRHLELSVINPVGVFGPVLGPDYSTSILLVQRLMDGAMPGCPAALFRSGRRARRRHFCIFAP